MRLAKSCQTLHRAEFCRASGLIASAYSNVTVARAFACSKGVSGIGRSVTRLKRTPSSSSAFAQGQSAGYGQGDQPDMGRTFLSLQMLLRLRCGHL